MASTAMRSYAEPKCQEISPKSIASMKVVFLPMTKNHSDVARIGFDFAMTVIDGGSPTCYCESSERMIFCHETNSVLNRDNVATKCCTDELAIFKDLLISTEMLMQAVVQRWPEKGIITKGERLRKIKHVPMGGTGFIRRLMSLMLSGLRDKRKEALWRNIWLLSQRLCA